MPRKILLGNLQQDRRGQRVTAEMLVDLKVEKIQEIRGFCPTATRFLHSKIGVEIYSIDGIVHLECMLFENHQSQLIYEMAGRPGVSNLSTDNLDDTDIFFLEYAILNREITNIPAAILVATSPTLTREDIQAISPEAEDRRRIRKASRPRNGELLDFPSVNGPTRLEVPEIPKLLPTGSKVEIIATVKDLPPKRALLGAIQPLDSGHGKAGHLNLLPEMVARRQIHGDAAIMGALLLESRDHRMPVRIEAVVLDNWIDGEHCLLDILTATRL